MAETAKFEAVGMIVDISPARSEGHRWENYAGEHGAIDGPMKPAEATVRLTPVSLPCEPGDFNEALGNIAKLGELHVTFEKRAASEPVELNVEVDVPKLVNRYFTLKVKRVRRVSVGMWLIRLGCWLANLPLEIEGRID